MGWTTGVQFLVKAELSTTPMSALESHTTTFSLETVILSLVVKQLKDEAENSFLVHIALE
jgi:hypothetical protein